MGSRGQVVRWQEVAGNKVAARPLVHHSQSVRQHDDSKLRGPHSVAKAMTLAESVYKTTQQLPREERYGLTSQMRRAAVSIPSNIAEGEGRGSDGQLLHGLTISYGSIAGT